MPARYLPLAESAKAPLPGSRRLGPAPPDEPVAVTVLLRGCTVPAAAGRLTRDDYARSYAASDADVAAVRSFATRHGLEVSSVSTVKRTLTLTGSAAHVGAAFRVR